MGWAFTTTCSPGGGQIPLVMLGTFGRARIAPVILGVFSGGWVTLIMFSGGRVTLIMLGMFSGGRVTPIVLGMFIRIMVAIAVLIMGF